MHSRTLPSPHISFENTPPTLQPMMIKSTPLLSSAYLYPSALNSESLVLQGGGGGGHSLSSFCPPHTRKTLDITKLASRQP